MTTTPASRGANETYESGLFAPLFAAEDRHFWFQAAQPHPGSGARPAHGRLAGWLSCARGRLRHGLCAATVGATLPAWRGHRPGPVRGRSGVCPTARSLPARLRRRLQLALCRAVPSDRPFRRAGTPGGRPRCAAATPQGIGARGAAGSDGARSHVVVELRRHAGVSLSPLRNARPGGSTAQRRLRGRVFDAVHGPALPTGLADAPLVGTGQWRRCRSRAIARTS